MNKPVWPPDVIEFLDSFLKKDMVVFEWGTGYSTIWLAKRVKFVYTMEHDGNWKSRIYEEAVKNGVEDKIKFLFHPIEVEYYHKGINDLKIKFDFIEVDGRNRVKCFNEAVKVIKGTGVIMLDDSERERYKEVFERDDVDWTLSLEGTAEGEKEPQQTAFFRRRLAVSR